MMKKYGISSTTKIFHCGFSSDYSKLFQQIIYELQTGQRNFEEMLVILLTQIFILIHRNIGTKTTAHTFLTENEMEAATQYFNANYNTNISIEEYASSRGMSISWFIRCFKQYTGSTPMQYVLSLRITNAQLLLVNSNYSVKEIAYIVGYDNPFYFSRIFKKACGCSPMAYRNAYCASNPSS